MSTFCHSCTAPLDAPDFKGVSDIYCKYCTDENGKLKPRTEIQRGIAEWFKSWQGDINDGQAMKRADLFMNAMPAWADD